MGFPPTFTDTWDITHPPDTQQANLLGQDIRNLKNDITQRIALLSGTTANRPTPETVNATWGGAGYGLLFFATDTGIIWQWNGAAWVNVTTAFISSSITKYSDTSVHVYTTPTFSGVGNSITIPSTNLQVGSLVKFFARVNCPGPTDSGSPNCNVVIGSQTIASFSGGNLASVDFLLISGVFVIASASVETGYVSSNSSLAIYNGVDPISGGLTISTSFTASAPYSRTYTFDFLACEVVF